MSETPMAKTKLTLNGRFEVRKVGCEHCGRGIDAVEFHDMAGKMDVQRLTGEVAESLWPLIEAESARNSARFGALLNKGHVNDF